MTDKQPLIAAHEGELIFTDVAPRRRDVVWRYGGGDIVVGSVSVVYAYNVCMLELNLNGGACRKILGRKYDVLELLAIRTRLHVVDIVNALQLFRDIWKEVAK